MRCRSNINRLFSLCMLALVFGLHYVEADAQRRNRRSRRVTNPVINRDTGRTTTTSTTDSDAPTTPTDPRIVSTADDQPDDANASGGGNGAGNSGTRTGAQTRSTTSLEEEHDSMRGRMNRLSRQVTILTDKLTEMEKQQRTLVDLERLSRAEQRAESLRAQLRDVQMKEAELQARTDQLEYDVKPENIERTMGNTGSTRPEEAREARRRMLENERTRVRSQLDLMSQSRVRLESAIATADAEVERIRQRIDEAPASTTTTQVGASDNTSVTDTTSNRETAPAPTTPPPSPDTSPSGTPR